MPRKYPKVPRDSALCLVTDSGKDHERGWALIQVVASRLNVWAEAFRKWMSYSEIDAGVLIGVSTVDQPETCRLREEVSELRLTKEILKTVRAFSQRIFIAPRLGNLIGGC